MSKIDGWQLVERRVNVASVDERMNKKGWADEAIRIKLNQLGGMSNQWPLSPTVAALAQAYQRWSEGCCLVETPIYYGYIDKVQLDRLLSYERMASKLPPKRKRLHGGRWGKRVKR